MIDGRKVLAIIPARGGSKGLPGKNIKMLAGQPLLAWTIEAARKSAYIDRLILSSDDPEIIRVAKDFGCEVPFVRPKELAADDTPGISPVLHALSLLPGYDYVALLQPTSPLRLAEDIDACLERCHHAQAPACVSVTQAAQSPYWMYKFETGDRLTPFLADASRFARRQDLPAAYALNGAVYVGRVESVLADQTFLGPETVGQVMPEARSADIDGERDFAWIEFLLTRKGRE